MKKIASQQSLGRGCVCKYTHASIMDNVIEYLTEGSTIGVKASIHIDSNVLRIVGEKVTFINTKNE